MQKIGPHVIQPTAPALSWAARANIVKALDTIAPLETAPPHAIRIFRHYFSDQPLVNPQQVANAILSALGGYRHPNLYAEVYNEVGKEKLLPYIELLKEVVPLLHSNGLKVAGPSWATGDYEAYDWEQFRKANWCGLDAIALHCYWGVQEFTEWHALRFRKYWNTDPPILITECGIDAIEGGEAGWKDTVSAEAYIDDLKIYDQLLGQDPHVLGATVFTAGPTLAWENFSTDGLMIPETTPIVEEEPMQKFQIGNKWYDSMIGQLPTRDGAAPYRKRAFSEIAEITIHHSGSDQYLLTPTDLAREMVTHQDPGRCQYSEIPYHIVIQQNGHVTVCLPLDTLSWHADGQDAKEGVGMNNWRGVGIVMIGDFSTHPPSGAQLASLKELCPELEFAMGNPLGHVRHSDRQNTSCPGNTSRGAGNWFDTLFNPVDDSLSVAETCKRLLEENATLKLRDAAQQALLARLLTIHEETAGLIRLNM